MTNTNKLDRAARLRWVPIEKMRVSPVAQRELKQARVDHLASNFDLEQLGYPTVNERDSVFYLIDGQHRIEALKVMGWGDQQVQCQTYFGLTDEEMADRFDVLNDQLAVHAFDKFRIRVAAGRDVESDIDRIVRAQGLVVSKDHSLSGSIQAVGTLTKLYKRSDPGTVGTTLRVIRDAYGDAGFEAAVIDGIGHLCQRYNGDLTEEHAVERLAKANGGVNGLLGQAERLRHQTGNQKAHCVAAAAVEIINRGKGGKKLASWWKDGS